MGVAVAVPLHRGGRRGLAFLITTSLASWSQALCLLVITGPRGYLGSIGTGFEGVVATERQMERYRRQLVDSVLVLSPLNALGVVTTSDSDIIEFVAMCCG